MRQGKGALGGQIVISLIVGLLVAVGGGADLAGAQVSPGRAAAKPPLGTVVVTIAAPAGVPGTVTLRSGAKTRVVTKKPAGTSQKVKVKVPLGRWVISAGDVVDDSRLYAGTSSKARVRVKARKSVAVKVTYRAAPAASGLEVEQLAPDRVGLVWTAPSVTAEYVVRRAAGPEAPASPEAGTSVPVEGTSALAEGLSPESMHSFSVFAREPGTIRWYGPVSTSVTTPALGSDTESAVVVTNPTTILVTDPTDVVATPTLTGVQASVPPGQTATVGQPWVLPHSSKVPGGMVGKVASVAPDGRTVNLVPAGLGDAFDYAEINVPDLAGVATSARSAERESNRLLDLECEGTRDRAIGFDRTFERFGHFSATLKKKELRFAPDIPVGVSFNAEFGVELAVFLGVKLSGSVACEVELPEIEVPFMVGPVPMRLEIEPEISFSASGNIDMTGLNFSSRLGASFEGYVGLGDDDFDGDLIAEADLAGPSVVAAGAIDVTAGVEVSLGPGVGKKGKAGATVGVAATLNPIELHATAASSKCLEIRVERSANVSLDVEAWLGDLEFERTVSVPGLGGTAPYGGSPWAFPNGCGGSFEYRLASGTLDVSNDWSASCSDDEGVCADDDPEWHSTHSTTQSDDASLRVTEPGEWISQYQDYRTHLSAPMAFNSWSFSARDVGTWSGYGCSSRHIRQTVGPVEFGGAFWETGVDILPENGTLDADLSNWWWGQDEPSEEWTADWWYGQLGAWDTDYDNGYPRIRYRSTSEYGGECEGSSEYEDYHLLEHLGLSGWWSNPEEARRSAHSVTVTELDGCTEKLCRWQVDGTETYQYRSSLDDWGLDGSGSSTVTWSYVVERRPVGAQ